MLPNQLSCIRSILKKILFQKKKKMFEEKHFFLLCSAQTLRVTFYFQPVLHMCAACSRRNEYFFFLFKKLSIHLTLKREYTAFHNVCINGTSVKIELSDWLMSAMLTPKVVKLSACTRALSSGRITIGPQVIGVLDWLLVRAFSIFNLAHDRRMPASLPTQVRFDCTGTPSCRHLFQRHNALLKQSLRVPALGTFSGVRTYLLKPGTHWAKYFLL